MKITDLFYQSAYCGIPPYWCVQYINEGDSFVSYAYFSSGEEAIEWAIENGADEGVL